MLKRSEDRCPTHPGAILREFILPNQSMDKPQIAKYLNISLQTFNDILNEKQPITAEIAVCLECVFYTTAECWLNMQNEHDLWQAKQKYETDFND
jgi:addiction module HigA family antidote